MFAQQIEYQSFRVVCVQPVRYHSNEVWQACLEDKESLRINSAYWSTTFDQRRH